MIHAFLTYFLVWIIEKQSLDKVQYSLIFFFFLLILGQYQYQIKTALIIVVVQCAALTCVTPCFFEKHTDEGCSHYTISL